MKDDKAPALASTTFTDGRFNYKISVFKENMVIDITNISDGSYIDRLYVSLRVALKSLSEGIVKKRGRKKKPVIFSSVVTDGEFDYKADYGEKEIAVESCDHVDGHIIHSFNIPLWDATGLIVDAYAASMVRGTYPEGEDHTPTQPIDNNSEVQVGVTQKGEQ